MNRVLLSLRYVAELRLLIQYPLKMGKILMENVVEKVCHQCVVRQIAGINKCVKMPRKNESDPIVGPRVRSRLIVATRYTRP